MNQTPNARHWLGGDLKAYVDGELPAWRHRVAAWHIERCASCRGEAVWLQQMNGQFAEWENDAGLLPRPELRARILACLPAESPLQLAQRESVLKPRASYRPVMRPTLALGSLAAIFLLMVGGFALNLRHSANAPANTNAPIAADLAATDKPLRVISIFTAPKNSFDAAKAVTTSVSGSPGNASAQLVASETSAASEGKSNTSGNHSSPIPSDEIYTDPTSREAERRASIAIGKMLTARHQQMLANAKHAPSPQPHSNPANGTATAAASQVALAVADVSEARQQLQQWAETAGAKLRVMAEKGNQPALLTPNGTPLSPGTLLEMRVPARFANSLQMHLSQIGTPLPTAGVGMKTLRALTLLESGAVVGQAPVLPPPSTAIPIPANGNNNAFVTIRVRLLPGEPTVQP